MGTSEDLLASRDRIITTADLGRIGADPRRPERLTDAGALVRIRRGSYVDADVWRAAGPRARHRLRVLAAGIDLPDAVFSHQSAAAVWGLPIVGAWPDAVDVRGPWTGGGRSSKGLRWHGSDRPPVVVEREGVTVTSAAQTLVDLARTSSFASAVVSTDYALRAGLVSRQVLEEEVASLGSVRGVRRASAVVAFADGRSESVGESLSRARVRELGLVVPELQVDVSDRSGFVARVDFWWPDVRLVGEFDGRQKYRTEGVDDGRPAEERVWAEKVREDRIRATGRGVTRWTWGTALDPRRLHAHLRAAGVRRVGRR